MTCGTLLMLSEAYILSLSTSINIPKKPQILYFHVDAINPVQMTGSTVLRKVPAKNIE